MKIIIALLLLLPLPAMAIPLNGYDNPQDTYLMAENPANPGHILETDCYVRANWDGDRLICPYFETNQGLTANWINLQNGGIFNGGYSQFSDVVVHNSMQFFGNIWGGHDVGWPLKPVTTQGQTCTDTCFRSCIFGQKENAMLVPCSSKESVQCLCGFQQ